MLSTSPYQPTYVAENMDFNLNQIYLYISVYFLNK